MGLDATSAVDALSGALLLGLGLFVGSVRPRRSVNTAFATFSACFGLMFVLYNGIGFTAAGGLAEALVPFGGLAAIPAIVSLIILAVRFPAPLGPGEGRLVVAPAALAAVSLAAWIMALVDRGLLTDAPAVAARMVVPLHAAMWSTLVLLALRFRRAGGEGAARDRAQIAIMSGALALYPGFWMGSFLGATGWPVFRLPMVLAAALLVVLWLRNIRAPAPPPPSIARNLALLIPALVLAGFLWGTFLGPDRVVSGEGAYGIARTLTVALLAYAILKYQLFDIDVKVRWTVKQSTVAAAFVGVFFVASEGAQLVLSERLGAFAGLGAAGLLVFALAPLQRAAERVADRAVPGVRPHDPAYLMERKRETYRNALDLAWRDRTLSPADARHLRDLREVLGLTPQEYDALERARIG